MNIIRINDKQDRTNAIINNNIIEVNYNDDEILTGCGSWLEFSATQVPGTLNVNVFVTRNENWDNIQWAFGDGTSGGGLTPETSGVDTSAVIHTYTSAGTYEISGYAFWSPNNITNPVDGTTYEITVSAIPADPIEMTKYTFGTSGDDRTDTGTISVLEMINRLRDLHDADLTPVEFLQRYANNLGYNVDVNRGEFGNLQENTLDEERYLRFMLRNLPNWYKIKTTRKSVKTLLFSFGLVGDTLYWYTKNYDENDQNDWILSEYIVKDGKIQEDPTKIPDDHYPTAHFMVWYDLLKSRAGTGFDTEKIGQISKAINSIRPANGVFTGMGTIITCTDNLRMNTISENKMDITLISDGVVEGSWINQGTPPA